VSLAGNRWALEALRERRLELGLSLEKVAEEIGISRVFLGNLERKDCRAAPEYQAALATFYGRSVNDLFESPASVNYKLPPRRGEWGLESEAARILGLTGQGVSDLVKKGIIERRGGRSRYRYHCPTLEALVPPGSLTIPELAERTGLSKDQLYRRRRRGQLTTFQPWPGAALCVLAEDAESFEEQLAAPPAKQRFSAEALARLSATQRAYIRTPAGQRRQGQLIERFKQARKDARREIERLKREEALLETEEVAIRLSVSTMAVSDYAASGWLHPRRVRINGFLFLLYEERDLDAFERRWALHLRDGRPSRSGLSWLDEDTVVNWHRSRGLLEKLAEKRGLSLVEAEALVRDRTRRRRAQLMNRRRGRRGGAEKPPHHFEWANDFEQTKAEFERDCELGLRDTPPSDYEIARDVARRDIGRHADRWRGYDANHAKSLKDAASRILNAVKALQSGQIENRAA
jgi:transcriptional regulator with XRE-family HTH domain